MEARSVIPLVRPSIPPPAEWLHFYEESSRVGIFSNFGPCERRATFTLSELTNKTAVLVSSGTAAVQAIAATCTKDGARIAVPDFTFAATKNAVEMTGRKAVIAPCNHFGLPVHDWLAGHSADFDAFVVTAPFGCHPDFKYYDGLAHAMSKQVFYDCAGGWGIDFSSTANPIAISFHATKNLPIGEGGAVLFGLVDERSEMAKMVINFVGPRGFNGKLSEVHAAILCAQLEPKNLLAAEQRAIHRKTLLGIYAANCERLEARTFSSGAPSLCAFIDRRMKPQEIIDTLGAHGVSAKRGYWPLMASHPETHVDLSGVVVLPSAVTVKEAEQIAMLINAKG